MEGQRRRLRTVRLRIPSWPMVARPEPVGRCVGGVGVLLVGACGRGGGAPRRKTRLTNLGSRLCVLTCLSCTGP